jgi:hypothetical protein
MGTVRRGLRVVAARSRVPAQQPRGAGACGSPIASGPLRRLVTRRGRAHTPTDLKTMTLLLGARGACGGTTVNPWLWSLAAPASARRRFPMFRLALVYHHMLHSAEFQVRAHAPAPPCLPPPLRRRTHRHCHRCRESRRVVLGCVAAGSALTSDLRPALHTAQAPSARAFVQVMGPPGKLLNRLELPQLRGTDAATQQGALRTVLERTRGDHRAALMWDWAASREDAAPAASEAPQALRSKAEQLEDIRRQLQCERPGARRGETRARHGRAFAGLHSQTAAESRLSLTASTAPYLMELLASAGRDAWNLFWHEPGMPNLQRPRFTQPSEVPAAPQKSRKYAGRTDAAGA